MATLVFGVRRRRNIGCCRRDTTGKTLLLFINDARCPAFRTKINTFPKYGNGLISPSVPRSLRARRDRHERRERDAMDAVVPQGVRRGRVRSSRVVLAPRRWCQALSMMIDEVTGANKPDTPGRARSSRSNHCAGSAGCFRPTCGDYACGPPTLFCPRGCGCARRPAFPAPSLWRGTPNCKTRARNRVAGNCRFHRHSSPRRCRRPGEHLSAQSRARAEATQYSRGLSVDHCRLWNTGSSGQAGRRQWSAV